MGRDGEGIGRGGMGEKRMRKGVTGRKRRIRGGEEGKF